MRNVSQTIFVNSIIIGLLIFPNWMVASGFNPELNKYKTLSAIGCDSLIKANENNPDFVILDIRTPGVWRSDHLFGSINRNFYDTDFRSQLEALPKHKIFLLHCQSGGRSAQAFSMMKSLNFSEVYEMKGGINSWYSSNLSTTSTLSPRIMVDSREDAHDTEICYDIADTIDLKITNRGNDTLKISSITFPSGGEFSSDFDLKRNLMGAEDYLFSVFYKPKQYSKDSVKIEIFSNGGNLAIVFKIRDRISQIAPTSINEEPFIFPNPARNIIGFKYLESPIQDLKIVDMNCFSINKELNL